VGGIRQPDTFDPTPEQRIVINHRGRPLVVVAGPGTGKTRTIVERMIELLREDPRRVVSFITFTRTSRRDTDKKLRQAVGRRAVEVEPESFPRISTMHRFAKSLVHRYAPSVGRAENFSVLAPREKDILIAEVIDDLGLALSADELDKAITQFRATGQWPELSPVRARQRLEVVEAFESLLEFYNTFDWEGLVLVACGILKRGASDLPPVLLQVDEYQDLNRVDQELIRLASGNPSSEVVVVGDDAQSIYGMRHAHPVGIKELWESEDWEKVRFQECQRLPPHILLASQSLIKGKGYLGAEVTLPEDDGRRLVTFRCTRGQQIKAVAGHIRTLLQTGKKGTGGALTHKDFMVLCPTNPQVNEVAAQLDERHGIPTKKRGDPVPDDVWRLLLVLRMVRDCDSLALRQWVELAGLSHAEIRAVRTEAAESRRSLYDHCSTSNDERIVGIFSSIDQVRNASDDPPEFQRAVLGFPFLAPGMDAALVIDEVVEYLPSVGAMITRVYERYGVIDAEGESHDVSDDDKVLVTTMHSAKGLEAEFVFIMWLNDWAIPFQGRDRAEEERVFYVALTRARQDVILTFEERFDPVSRRYLTEEAMSPFLESIRNHLDVQRVRASDLRAQGTAVGA
jgi:superfamily I DNA/RNA helicase